MSKRAEALASRIEQGAAEVAASSESLTEQDWNTPISNLCSCLQTWTL